MPPFDFDTTDLHRMRRLSFAARLPGAIRQEGQHRCRRAGEGLEFLDYRPYVPGDDLRHIDWSLYGRFRQLVMRIYESQENLSITVLVDSSRSMSFGTPTSKAVHACRIACGLAHVALSQGEQLHVGAFGEDLAPLVGPLQRTSQLGQVVEYLRQMTVKGSTSFCKSLHSFCVRMRRKGLVVVISDFLGNDSYAEGLRLVLARGCKVLLVQILDPIDLGTGLEGYLRIRDSETGEERLVLVDEAMRHRVRKAAQAFTEALESWSRSHRQRYIQTFTHEGYLEVVCHALRSGTGVR